jgi:hypothetical protein
MVLMTPIVAGAVPFSTGEKIFFTLSNLRAAKRLDAFKQFQGVVAMQYHCLIYFDPKEVFSGTPEANALLAEIGPHTAELKAKGEFVMAQPLNLPQEAMTVTMRDGKMSATDGPFMETKEMLGGLVVIEARDLNDALRIASSFPHARLGHIEVRSAIDYSSPRPKL